MCGVFPQIDVLDVKQISKQQQANSTGVWLLDGPEPTVSVTEKLQAFLQVLTITLKCLQHLARLTLAVCLMCARVGI